MHPRSHPSLPTADERTPGLAPQSRAGTGTSPGTLVCDVTCMDFRRSRLLTSKTSIGGNHLPEKEAVQEAHAHRTCPGFGGHVRVPRPALRRHARKLASSTLGGAGSWASSHLLAAPQPQAALLPSGCPLACRQCLGQHGASLGPRPTQDGGPSLVFTAPYPQRTSGSGGNTGLGWAGPWGLSLSFSSLRLWFSNKRRHVRFEAAAWKAGQGTGGLEVQPGLCLRAWAAMEVPSATSLFFGHSFMEVA